MGVILPGVERDGIFPQFFSWDWDGKRFIFVGVGRERFENSLPCHPLIHASNFAVSYRLCVLVFMYTDQSDYIFKEQHLISDAGDI